MYTSVKVYFLSSTKPFICSFRITLKDSHTEAVSAMNNRHLNLCLVMSESRTRDTFHGTLQAQISHIHFCQPSVLCKGFAFVRMHARAREDPLIGGFSIHGFS
jgi:hypothetical protein